MPTISAVGTFILYNVCTKSSCLLVNRLSGTVDVDAKGGAEDMRGCGSALLIKGQHLIPISLWLVFYFSCVSTTGLALRSLSEVVLSEAATRIRLRDNGLD